MLSERSIAAGAFLAVMAGLGLVVTGNGRPADALRASSPASPSHWWRWASRQPVFCPGRGALLQEAIGARVIVNALGALTG